MMTIISALPLAVLIAILVVLLEAGIQTLIDELRRVSECRKEHKTNDNLSSNPDNRPVAD